MKKHLVTGLVITAIATGTLMPQAALADGHLSNPKQASAQDLTSTLTLSNSIRTLGNQSPLIQAYGLVILKQPIVQINAMSILKNNQHIAKNNVNEWLDFYNPMIMEVNENMLRYSTTFNNYYDTLYKLAGKINESEKDKASFIRAFNKLQTQVKTIQNNMERSSIELNRYKDKVVTDNKDFSVEANKAIQSLDGKDGQIDQLREKIKQIQADIQVEITKIINVPKEDSKASINISKQIFNISNSAMEKNTVDYKSLEAFVDQVIEISDNQTKESAMIIQQKVNELKPLMSTLSAKEIQATRVTVIEDNINAYTQIISRQISTFGYLVDDWKNMSMIMNQIQIDLNTDNTDEVLLQNQLKNLKKTNDDLNKQTHQSQDLFSNIKIN